MVYKTLLLLHVCCAVVGLLAGFLSMMFRKGSGLHRAAGTIFFAAMLGMAGAGVFIAAFLKPNNGNVMGGSLLTYLVTTGWIAGQRREQQVGMVDFGALLVAMAIAAAGATWGFQATSSHSGLKDGYSAPLYFIFALIAALFAVADIRVIRLGGVFGTQRIARHAWRMSLGLVFALLSFYPGQGRLFSKALDQSNLLYVPHVLVIGVTIFWMARLSRRRRSRRTEALPYQPSLELAR